MDLNRGPAGDAEDAVGLRFPRRFRGAFESILAILLDDRETAILADPPHVPDRDREEHQRQQGAVEDVEADQGRLADDGAAEEELADGLAHRRHAGGDVGSHCDRPVCELVPG